MKGLTATPLILGTVLGLLYIGLTWFLPDRLSFHPLSDSEVATSTDPITEGKPFENSGGAASQPSKPEAQTTAELLRGMKLTFSDEFNSFSRYVDGNGNVTCGPGGTGTWQTVLHFCYRTIPSNNEEQLYLDPGFLAYLKKISVEEATVDPDNPFSVEDGVLSIKVAPITPLISSAAGPWAKYTSGLITTQFSFSQTYGYFEMRARLPPGRGVWPAFWLLPVDKSWPPEIDILETFGDTSVKGEGGRTQIHYASHPTKRSDSCEGWHDVKVDVTEGFHTYGVNWQPDGITYFFDGKAYAKCPANPETAKPFYLLVNTAVSGKWPGKADLSNTWPVFMRIDYVRVYHSKQAQLSVVACYEGDNCDSPTSGVLSQKDERHDDSPKDNFYPSLFGGYISNLGFWRVVVPVVSRLPQLRRVVARV